MNQSVAKASPPVYPWWISTPSFRRWPVRLSCKAGTLRRFVVRRDWGCLVSRSNMMGMRWKLENEGKGKNRGRRCCVTVLAADGQLTQLICSLQSSPLPIGSFTRNCSADGVPPHVLYVRLRACLTTWIQTSVWISPWESRVMSSFLFTIAIFLGCF